jgi:hypothetical protein
MRLWTGRVVTILVAAFLLFDAVVKLLRLAPAVTGTVELGFPASTVAPLGFAELVCLVLYLTPRTSILGAILLTGYLGGATAAKVRLEDPWFLFSVVFGLLVWAALVIRDADLGFLLPVRRA